MTPEEEAKKAAEEEKMKTILAARLAVQAEAGGEYLLHLLY